MQQSTIKETGNILCSAYMNALSDFLGMMLLPSVPALVIDLAGAVLTTAYLNFGHDRDTVFCVETAFRIEGSAEAMTGQFLLMPDPPSLTAIFDAIRIAN
jgi:chemotaxis protein CheC